jgi:hypothetical protein
MPIPTSRPQLEADGFDFTTQLATDISDDLHLTQSSPVRASRDPVEDESGVFFTMRSSEAEHRALVERARRGAGQVQGGLKTCPISLGWTTKDMLERLQNDVSQSYLSWSFYAI